MKIGDFIHRSSHIWKTALAAALSWDAVQVTGMKHTFFAPVAAIICLQVTVEDSVLKGYSRVLGIIVGVTLADVLVNFTGIHDWSIALLLSISLGLTTLMKFKQDTISQVGVTALLVMTVGAGDFNYGIERIIETIIGAFIAIIINMIILPPDFTATANRSVTKTKKDMAQHFTKLSTQLENGASIGVANELLETTEKLNVDVQEAQKAVDQALHASKFSPLAKHRLGKMLHIKGNLESLEQVYKLTIAMQNTLIGCRDYGGITEEERKQWSERIEKLARVVETWDGNDGDGDLKTTASEILKLHELRR